ncbi:MAG: helix-turn-helix domain-containing protein [Thiogranum sp.]
MANAATLIATLKIALKVHGLTYRDVAAGLGLSEASVKRLFSEGSFSLERLEAVCRLLDMSIGDLVRLADTGGPDLEELTAEQEQELVSDQKLLLVAVLVVQGWEFDDILARYRLEGPELVHCLARLDRLRLIDLLPKNRIKRLIAPNFAWRRNGPIEQYFSENVLGVFLHSRFDRPDESLAFVYGLLSDRSNALIQRRLEQVAREFNDLHREDQRLPLGRRKGSSMILAIRSWDFFAGLRRPEAG